MPSSLFDEYGLMRKGTKAVLTKKLSVAPEHPQIYDGFIIDGNEMIYHVTWPKTSNVLQFQYNFVKAVDRKKCRRVCGL